MANEKRLIDLDEAIDALGVEDRDFYCKHFLEERPIVDAVEVVRCKDCQHRYTASSGVIFCTQHITASAKDDDFCSYGEKRIEGE